MKYPIMLVCALVASMSMSVMAENAAAGAATPAKTAEKAKGAKLTAAEKEARITKQLDAIKAKDEALYKELVALREKDPAAFKAKMMELRQQNMKAAKAQKTTETKK